MAKNIDEKAAMERWQQVDFSNKFMFRLVMDDPELCRRVLEVILGITICKLNYVEPEKNFEAQLRSKGIRLDVYIEDADGVAYDLEMQATDADGIALGKRTRYYQALVDQNLLKHGMFYAKLPKSMVIFICKYDPFEKNLLKYTFKNICQEDAKVDLQDESYKVIINTKGELKNASPELVSFINFVNTGEASDDLTNKLADAVAKERSDNGKAVLYMTWEQTLMEENYKGRIEGKAEGKAEGKTESKIETAEMMLKDKEPLAKIQKYTQLSASRIKEIASSIGVAVIM